MKQLDEIFELFEGIIPAKSKAKVFCEVEDKAYEIYYYLFSDDGSYKQCFELVEEDVIDSKTLEECFEKVAEYIRSSDKYDAGKRNVVTILIDGTSEQVDVQQFDKSIGLYKIKKEWKSANLV